MSNWQIWCLAVVKTEEGPLLHFCIRWSGLSCNSLHSNNCQIFANILLKISFEYFSKAPPSILSFFALDVVRRPPVQQLLGIRKKIVAGLIFFKNITLVTKKRMRRYTLLFRWGDGIYECFLKPKCTNKEKIRFFVKFVLPTSKSRKMSLLNVLSRDKIFW